MFERLRPFRPALPDSLVQRDIQTQARWGVLNGTRAIETGYQMIELANQGKFSWVDLANSKLTRKQERQYAHAMLIAHLKAGILRFPTSGRRDKRVRQLIKEHGQYVYKDEQDRSPAVRLSPHGSIESNVKGYQKELILATARLINSVRSNQLTTTAGSLQEAAQTIQSTTTATGSVEQQILTTIFTAGHTLLYPEGKRPLKPTDLVENGNVHQRWGNPINNKLKHLLKERMEQDTAQYNLPILPQAIDSFIKDLFEMVFRTRWT